MGVLVWALRRCLIGAPDNPARHLGFDRGLLFQPIDRVLELPLLAEVEEEGVLQLDLGCTRPETEGGVEWPRTYSHQSPLSNTVNAGQAGSASEPGIVQRRCT